MELEIKSKIEKIGSDFELFKQKNDERLAALEKKGVADPLVVEEMKKIQAAIAETQEAKAKLEEEVAELQKKGNRARFSANGKEISQEAAEHKEAFGRFIRTGEEKGLRELERKAMSVGTDADGGYAVTEEMDNEVYSLVKQVSKFREEARVIRVGNNNYKKLVNVHGTASGWVGETDARTDTASSQLAELTPFMGEIYANPKATQTMLDDGMFNVEQFIADEISLEFAKQEGTSFITGDGTNKPKGFLSYTMATTDDGVRAFGSIQYVATGVAGDWAASNKFDILKTVRGKLKEELLPGAKWLANNSIKIEMETFKDSTGQYLWRPSLEAGAPETFDGYPIKSMPGMPVKATNSYSVAFGNFKLGYQVVDRIGIRVLRDPFTAKPYVCFYSTKRVGGMVVDSEAIKVVKFGVS